MGSQLQNICAQPAKLAPNDPPPINFTGANLGVVRARTERRVGARSRVQKLDGSKRFGRYIPMSNIVEIRKGPRISRLALEKCEIS